MPKGDYRIILSFCALFLLGLFYILVYNPLQSETEELEASLYLQRQEKRELEEKIREGHRKKERIEELEDIWSEYRIYMFQSREERKDWKEIENEKIKDLGLEELFREETEEDHSFPEVEVFCREMKLQGKFEGLFRFVRWMEKEHPLFIFRQIAFEDNKKPVLHFKAESFLLSEGGRQDG